MSNAIVCIGTILLSLGLTQAATAEDSAPTAETKPIKATFLITGLHCPPCARTVESSLRGIKGVKSAKVDWNSKNAHVDFDESVLTAQALAQRIATTAHMMGGGMQYGGWLALKIPSWNDTTTASVEAALKDRAGVKKVVPYPAQKSIGIQFGSGTELTSQTLIEALKKSGIEASNL